MEQGFFLNEAGEESTLGQLVRVISGCHEKKNSVRFCPKARIRGE